MLNLKGKYHYISGLINNYDNWASIVKGRLVHIVTPYVKLKNGLTISGGPKSEIVDIVDEIFFQKVYTPEFLKIKKGDTVIDIGANIGVFGLFAAKNGARKIIAVEPYSKNVDSIKKNFKTNKLNTPKTLQAAVSDKIGKSKLYLGDIDSHNLLFDHNFKNEKYTKFIDVPVTTLSGILKKYGLKNVDFLKIDCEGSEGDIVKSTPLNIWKKIKKIAMEYHNGVSSLSCDEMVTKLKKVGYKVVIKRSDDNFGYIYAY